VTLDRQIVAIECPRAREAIEFYQAVEAATDEGSRILARQIQSMTLPELISMMSRIKPPPKKRGPKGRRAWLAAIDEKARANLIAATGVEPTWSALAREVARLRGNPDQVANIARDHRRVRNRTK
jgi:hypothetical protein